MADKAKRTGIRGITVSEAIEMIWVREERQICEGCHVCLAGFVRLTVRRAKPHRGANLKSAGHLHLVVGSHVMEDQLLAEWSYISDLVAPS
jgi:nucleoid DNA-binding protein